MSSPVILPVPAPEPNDPGYLILNAMGIGLWTNCQAYNCFIFVRLNLIN